MVLLEPEPPNKIFPSGTSVGFEEVTRIFRSSRLAGMNEASPLVKKIGPTDEFSSM